MGINCYKRFQTNVAKNFFTHSVIEKWNSLPQNVVNSDSIDSFKNNLDNHLKGLRN